MIVCTPCPSAIADYDLESNSCTCKDGNYFEGASQTCVTQTACKNMNFGINDIYCLNCSEFGLFADVNGVCRDWMSCYLTDNKVVVDKKCVDCVSGSTFNTDINICDCTDPLYTWDRYDNTCILKTSCTSSQRIVDSIGQCVTCSFAEESDDYVYDSVTEGCSSGEDCYLDSRTMVAGICSNCYTGSIYNNVTSTCDCDVENNYY